jgi:hypothetical protein
MKPILKWQYERLIKELLLLQDHQADPSCPCETDREMCVRKHLLTIEAYAEETVPIETNKDYRSKLEELAQEAKGFRAAEEASLRGADASFPMDTLEWPRRWRKEFEAYSLSEIEGE